MTWLRLLCLALGLLLAATGTRATPISSTPTHTFVGYIDYVGTGNTLRTSSDAVNPCAVGTSSSATLSGIPATATVEAAYLYWAGSGQTTDFTVNFNGSTVTADTQYTEDFSANESYFGGVEDVTALVSGNGTYSFSGLTVDTGEPYCSPNVVLAGWALVVIYSEASEPFRSINMFEGLQQFWGSSVTLSPTNFVIPGSAVDGRLGVLSFEGDAGNSGTRNFVSENLFFNGQNTAAIALTDALNPVNNQYNSTINGSGSSNVYGVDFDIYDISSSLRAGDTVASTIYQSGQDWVLLMLEILSVTNTPSTDLSLAKSAAGDFARGGTGEFEFTVSNLGPLTHNDVITISDTLPTGLTFAGFASTDPIWSCSGATAVTCVHTGAELLVGADLPSVTITVNVAANASGTLTNNASMVSNVFDAFPANNDASADAVIQEADLSGSQKTVTDLDSGLVQPGDTLQFVIDVVDANNTGALVTVTDTLSSLLTNLVVTDLAGGTDFSTASALDVRDIPVPNGSSAAVTFTADVVAGAIAGDVISNTATITDQLLSAGLDVSSVDLVVGDTSGPASGTKQLYLDNIQTGAPSASVPLTMSRVPLTSTSTPVNRLRIRRQDNAMVWDMTPATTGTLSLGSSAIPVRLLLRRSNNNSARDIRITLTYSGAASGTIGCVDQTVTGLANGTTNAITFNVPRTDSSCSPIPAGPLDLPAGTTIHMHVDNQVGGTGSGRAIFVYPFEAGLGTSNLELPATTVINVDSLEFYDAVHPGGSLLASVEAGDTVYIRSVVSDPFGSADITDAQLELENSAGASALSLDLDPASLVTSDAGTKTYEAAFTVPAAGPAGTWVARVTAFEGSEGTITHTRLTNLQVTLNPVITLSKVARTDSDPMASANPKSIPGAVIEFSIEVHNQGPGSADADSIVVVDNLPAQARLLFDTATMNPILFVDGSPASGLTYTFGGLSDTNDDIAFSNDGGVTPVVPTVDGSTGLDLTVPRINHLRINPQGVLVETPTGPSFTLQLLMQID